MKKLYFVVLLASCVMSLSACTKVVDAAQADYCNCRNCKCCTCDKAEDDASVKVENAEEVFVQESADAEETKTVEESVAEASETEESQTEEEVVTEMQTEEEVSVADLTEGEKAARKQQQINLVSAREQMYSLPNSLDKTLKINELDKQILANNSFDFSTKSIQFLGDSITEAICGAVDEEGDFISYVDYADDYLKFGNCINNGKAGRMFSDYGGEELSFSLNMGSMYTSSVDISVIYLGINDYLTNRENKRYGDMNVVDSTAGYIGSVRYALKQLKANYPNQDIFFVTAYDVAKTSNSTYSDVAGAPQLDEYMEVLRKLVKEYGYHIIEIYDTGFMDCSDETTSGIYTEDGIHPNDNGNHILGEHIAAELSVYYSQKQ